MWGYDIDVDESGACAPAFSGVIMGDAAEGLIDADARIQERMEDLEQERARKSSAAPLQNPELVRAIESLRLARTELERQLKTTTHERRRAQIGQAIEEIERRLVDARSRMML